MPLELPSVVTAEFAAKPLIELELIVAQGLATFLEVGEALIAIREGRKYQEVGFKTFDAYCRERWGFSRDYADRHITAAKVAGLLIPPSALPPLVSSTALPVNEAQARELAPLKDDPEALRAAWQDAQQTSDGQPTAKVVREAVKARRQPALAVSESPAAVDEIDTWLAEQPVVATTSTTDEIDTWLAQQPPEIVEPDLTGIPSPATFERAQQQLQGWLDEYAAYTGDQAFHQAQEYVLEALIVLQELGS